MIVGKAFNKYWDRNSHTIIYPFWEIILQNSPCRITIDSDGEIWMLQERKEFLATDIHRKDTLIYVYPSGKKYDL